MRAGRWMLLVLAVGACDGFRSSDWAGDPLITLRGRFVADEPPSSAGMELMWQDAVFAGGPGVEATRLQLQSDGSTGFAAAVPAPPSDRVMFHVVDGEPAIAEAFLVITGGPRHVARGIDRSHVLVYASADIAAGTATAAYLGHPVPAGFHLASYTQMDAPPPTQMGLVARCMASGSPAASCGARRAYQLGETDQESVLEVSLWPP